MIIDQAIRQTPRRLWNPRPVERVLPQARRFVMTEAASRRLGEIIRSCGRELIDNRQFALPPYPVTYVELCIKETFEGLGRPLMHPSILRSQTPTWGS